MLCCSIDVGEFGRHDAACPQRRMVPVSRTKIKLRDRTIFSLTTSTRVPSASVAWRCAQCRCFQVGTPCYPLQSAPSVRTLRRVVGCDWPLTGCLSTHSCCCICSLMWTVNTHYLLTRNNLLVLRKVCCDFLEIISRAPHAQLWRRSCCRGGTRTAWPWGSTSCLASSRSSPSSLGSSRSQATGMRG